MSSRACFAFLFCLIALPAPLTAAQSDAAVVQSFYDNMCAFAKSGDRLSEYTFLTKYLANSATSAMISGKPYGKSTALAELHSHEAPVKPASCFTEVRNVIRNGAQLIAEVTLHGLSGDNSAIIESVDRYRVVFVNSPPWQLLKSTELERWDLKNGKVFAHALLPGTTSQPPADAQSSGSALLSTGDNQFRQRQYADALESYQKALALFQQSSDRDGEAKALMSIGLVQGDLSGYADALQSERQALALFRQQNDRVEEARALLIIGFLQGGHEQETVALQSFEQALTLFEQLGDRDGEERTLNDIGITQARQGEYAVALQSFEQALALDRQLHDPDTEAQTLLNIGNLRESQNQFSDALQSYRQALTLFQQIGDQANAAIAEQRIEEVQSLTSAPCLRVCAWRVICLV
jgi:Tfp pilus assembly protein PilF